MSSSVDAARSTYRLELLPVVQPYHKKAQEGSLSEGQLVYYGPKPDYYGVGEVLRVGRRLVFVDFRGTGAFRVEQEAFEPQYIVPIPQDMLSLL